MESNHPFESQGMCLLRQLFMRGKRIFSTEDAKQAAQSEKIPITQVNKLISNLAKMGRVIRLRRGLYVCISLLPKQIETHPFIISAFLVQPSMISHWSALQYHGLTEQMPRVVTASTTSKVVTPSMRENKPHRTQAKHAWEINGIRYEYMTIQEKNFFGDEIIWPEEDLHVRITDKERTLLDLFVYPTLFGGIGEAMGILENALPSIGIKKLIGYAIRYNKKSVIKRLGWALEYFGVPVQELEPLLKTPIHYFCRLDPSLPAIGECDKKWMIQNNLMSRKS